MPDHAPETFVDTRSFGDARVSLINDGSGLSVMIRQLTVRSCTCDRTFSSAAARFAPSSSSALRHSRREATRLPSQGLIRRR